MKNRFIAEWCEKQYHDESGEWIPDRDEYSCSVAKDLESAKSLGIKNAKKAGIEWVKVEEQFYNDELGIPPSSDAAWDTLHEWHGDFDDNWEKTV